MRSEKKITEGRERRVAEIVRAYVNGDDANLANLTATSSSDSAGATIYAFARLVAAAADKLAEARGISRDDALDLVLGPR